MKTLIYKNGAYRTEAGRISAFSGLFPSAAFYRKMLSIVFRSSSRAKHSRYGNAEWAESSLDIIRALESVGVNMEITGIDYFRAIDGPCVFAANHMSTLETFVLPAIIEPFKDATFVVKQSLVDYPVFKHVMRSRDPVTVHRSNPREDLKAVLEGGTERIKTGRSIIVFPQAGRSLIFNPEIFNTIGVKLAKKAGAPIVPVALKTDAWGNGRYISDFGRIDPSKKVHFAFGRPLQVNGRGDEEHKAVIEFISSRLKEWSIQ